MRIRSPLWPTTYLHAATANNKDVRRIVTAIEQRFGPGPDAWIKPGGFNVYNTDLGETEGLLLPWIGSGLDLFRIAVNNRLKGDARDFLIAHEIGHSFFYQRGYNKPPRRSGAPFSENEERLCDLFAKYTTGLTAKQAGLSKRNGYRQLGAA